MRILTTAQRDEYFRLAEEEERMAGIIAASTSFLHPHDAQAGATMCRARAHAYREMALRPENA